jgi:hypothetical protein
VNDDDRTSLRPSILDVGDDLLSHSAIEAFEMLAREKVALGVRCSASFQGLVHPVHKQRQVVAWELLGRL